ncbi:MAG: IS607 family transposase [Promethearchaeota archaeon]
MRRWDRARLFLPAFRTPGNHRRYTLAQIQSFRERESRVPHNSPRTPPAVRAVTYARVSSSLQKQRGDLQRQVDELPRYCTRHGLTLLKSIQDVGSGLNDTRKGLHQVIRMVCRGKCDRVGIAYQDRLTRFGINVLKACFAEWGVPITTVNSLPLNATKERDLIADITAILYSYMGKLYRLHRRTAGRTAG